ncbi:Hypothetical predicted protein [Podarcis lilfordi]|uniref:Uncharacterized protein n=1 Tax=Podarcis lilfordi TaxID=74358 RepID=A0AA35JNN0_9SAUR|nr:Hypothetical predicted protein [Podarcis lilfordi]
MGREGQRGALGKSLCICWRGGPFWLTAWGCQSPGETSLTFGVRAVLRRPPEGAGLSSSAVFQHIFGHLERFRDRTLSLALALEALLQLSFMRPHFSSNMVSAILHRTMEAVLGSAEKDDDKEELKRHFQSLLLEAPNVGTLLQLLTLSVLMASGKLGQLGNTGLRALLLENSLYQRCHGLRRSTNSRRKGETS